jgi:hypothetical protein
MRKFLAKLKELYKKLLAMLRKKEEPPVAGEIPKTPETSPSPVPAPETKAPVLPPQIPVVTGNPSIDFIVAALGGARKGDPDQLRERDANLARWQENHPNEFFQGRIRVEDLTREDKVYLARMSAPFANKTGGKDIMRSGFVSGTNFYLNAARNEGEYWLNNVDLSTYDSDLRKLVEAYLGVEKKGL